MQKIKVFIVDDSIAARRMMKNILLTDDSIEIIGEAATGQGIIIMLDEFMPEIILLEASVAGGMDIYDVIKILKEKNKNLKIILCASSLERNKVIESTRYGADNFISKPYNKDDILLTIHQTMGSK